MYSKIFVLIVLIIQSHFGYSSTHDHVHVRRLYSWMNEAQYSRIVEHVKAAAKGERDSIVPIISKPYFAYKTPLAIGSFKYHDYSIRFVIKENVQLVDVSMMNQDSIPKRECHYLKSKFDVHNTIFSAATNVLGYKEYFFCSSNVLKSVSFATLDHFQEMLDQWKIIVNNPDNPQMWDMLVLAADGNRILNLKHEFLWQDAKYRGREKLKDNILKMLVLVLEENGQTISQHSVSSLYG